MNKQWYEDYQQELKAEQGHKSRDEIKDELQTKYEHVFDMDNHIPQKHIWIDRGLKLSCEHAGHAMHQVWLKHPLTKGEKVKHNVK